MLFIRRTRAGLRSGSAPPHRERDAEREDGREQGEAGDCKHEQYHATALKHIIQRANMLFSACACVCPQGFTKGSLLNSHIDHQGETAVL